MCKKIDILSLYKRTAKEHILYKKNGDFKKFFFTSVLLVGIFNHYFRFKTKLWFEKFFTFITQFIFSIKHNSYLFSCRYVYEITSFTSHKNEWEVGLKLQHSWGLYYPKSSLSTWTYCHMCCPPLFMYPLVKLLVQLSQLQTE